MRGIAVLAALVACSGSDIPPGEIADAPRASTESRQTRDASRILFGDLHVHTSYSIDAYLYGLPLFGSEGVHPPADACDFARHCAGLDFFALTDHAEALTPERWEASLDSLRACEDRGQRSGDVIPLAGFEWTQVGLTPETHFGHKNVIYPSLEPASLPRRPISALEDGFASRARFMGLARIGEAVLAPFSTPYADFLWWLRRIIEIPVCDSNTHTNDLPSDCHESAPTAEALFRKLDESGIPSLVIPHGLAWGIHAPSGARMDVQLTAARHDPGRQRLIEVYSGHGTGERYRADIAEAETRDRGRHLPSADA